MLICQLSREMFQDAIFVDFRDFEKIRLDKLQFETESLQVTLACQLSSKSVGR